MITLMSLHPYSLTSKVYVASTKMYLKFVFYDVKTYITYVKSSNVLSIQK